MIMFQCMFMVSKQSKTLIGIKKIKQQRNEIKQRDKDSRADKTGSIEGKTCE